MTNVISPSARKAGDIAAATAITTPPAIGNIERQHALDAAMLKAVPAASMLTHACIEATTSGRV